MCEWSCVFEKRISPTRMLEDVYADRKKTKDNDKKDEKKKVMDEIKELESIL
jgi:hypothetical protein